METPEEAARFMMQASLGASYEKIQAMVDTDATAWLAEEFAKPATDFLAPIVALRDADDLGGRPYSDVFWDALFEADDELRVRMTFALSQILVVGDDSFGGRPLQMAHYQDILSRNAFGNYRDLLEEVTYSPAMSRYLTYFRNRKGNPNTGRMPDENYARELLQLFTIGVIELNPDGTPRTDASGAEIETFDNDDIQGLARVFTGLAYAGTGFRDNSNPDRDFTPLQMYAEQHSELEKTFLTTTIPAGASGEESIDLALDEIFAHPNVPPFIARQLIQRFTASDPSPDYVERVADAFAAGTYTAFDGTVFGEGLRGDLEATLAAILLDDSMHGPVEDLAATQGKVREPVLKLVHWARAFDIADVDTDAEGRLSDTSRIADRLSQHPFRAPSVFNFYRPGFVAPGTESGAAGLTTPEFQIVNTGATIGYINFITDFVFDDTGGSSSPPRFTPDYSDEIAIADDPQALVARLNMLMTGNRMTPDEVAAVEEAVAALEITNEERDPRQRVEVAVLLIASSPSFAVIR